MSNRIGAGGIWMRLALCSAVALAAAAAHWVTPPPRTQLPTAAPVPQSVPVPHARHAPPMAGRSGGDFAGPGLAVTRWSLRSADGEDIAAGGHAPAGQPLTLSFTLDGNAAAVNQIRASGSIAIEVRWRRQSGAGAPGAPDLVTRLAIGQPGLADRLAAEVRRTGVFAWHGWAQKTSLSPGFWTVSLTYPDGTPLACGDPPAPCRFRIAVG